MLGSGDDLSSLVTDPCECISIFRFEHAGLSGLGKFFPVVLDDPGIIKLGGVFDIFGLKGKRIVL